MRRVVPLLSRYWWLLLLGAILLGCWPLGSWAVRARADQWAERRGVSLHGVRIRPGWGRLWLLEVGFQGESLRGNVDAVSLNLWRGDGFGSVEVHGGWLRATEAGLRAQQRGGSSGAEEERRRSVRWDGLHVVVEGWEGSYAAGGVAGARGTDGELALTIDHLQFARAGWSGELRGGEVQLAGGKLRTLHWAAATLQEGANDRGPLPLRPSAGTVAPAAQGGPTVPPPPAESEPWRRWTSLLDALHSRSWPNAKAGVDEVVITLKPGGSDLRLGPARWEAQRQGETSSFTFQTLSREATRPLSLKARWESKGPGAGRLHVELAGGPLTLAELGVREGDAGLFGVGKTQLEASGKLSLELPSCRANLEGAIALRGLGISQAWLSPRPVRDWEISFGGRARLDSEGKLLTLEGVELRSGQLVLRGGAEVGLESVGNADAPLWRRHRFRLQGELVPVACGSVLRGLPEGLLSQFTGAELDGSLGARGEVVYDPKRPQDATVGFTLEEHCSFRAIPTELHPSRFRESWSRTVPGKGGRLLQLVSGPGTPEWVPSGDLPPSLTQALQVCEDSRFFRHRGIDPRAIESAFRDNLRAGRFLRGGSTISMQLAKNLYLERRKDLARKIQEAFLTILLEQYFTKEELLELYLNIVELGPEIYGIGPAAAHYFQKPASELTLAESFFLVSILPAPTRSYFSADGQLGAGRARHLKHLMEIGVEAKLIDPVAAEAGMEEQVRMGSGAASPVDAGAASPSDASDGSAWKEGEEGAP